ncbi:periplasmic heavy metal sensor [Yoonia sp.]|uniref:periplasmic heavy metal sensor n=1 Tax=Yoonia sp. TaxID=2212373 RepID=UPI0035C83F19
MVEAGGKPRRLWKVVLVSSLAINLAVAGIVVGALSTGRIGDGPPRSFDFGVGPMARALMPHEQRDIRREMRNDRALRSVDFRTGLRNIEAALVADPFEPEDLRAALGTQRNKVSSVQTAAQEALIATVTDMTPERRAAFAAAVVEEMAKARPRGSRQGSGG